jgi:hypothetical protein
MMGRLLAWAVGCVVGAGCVSQQAPPEAPLIGFPVPPPIEGADPSTRRKQTIEVPTQLIVKRDGNRADVALDPRSFKVVEIDVGKKMVIGTRTTTTLLPEEENGGICLTDGVPTAGGSFEVGPGAAEVQVRVEVFETDIPAQHFWQPTSGKYRLLGEWRLRTSVPPR